jgi:FMN-dependent NADH-azoreductase
VSAPSFVLVPILNDSVVTQIKYVLGDAISVADSTITVTRGGGSAMGTQVIAQAASAEGTTFTQTPSGNNDITAATHHYIKIATDGASTTTAPLYITVRCRKVP